MVDMLFLTLIVDMLITHNLCYACAYNPEKYWKEEKYQAKI
jgi:hypothetical protein